LGRAKTKIVPERYGSYLKMDKGCFVVRNKERNEKKFPVLGIDLREIKHTQISDCDERALVSVFLVLENNWNAGGQNQSKVFNAPREMVSEISSTNLMCSALSDAREPFSTMGLKSRSSAPL
jgi:hypothetical protein